MNEGEWLTAQDPLPMLDFLEGKASERKFRLFACACARRHWGLFRYRAPRGEFPLVFLETGDLTHGPRPPAVVVDCRQR